MAKYIDAEKIRAEIERRKKENMYYELPMTIGRYYEDRDLLSFLDTLEELDIELINRSWYMEGYHDREFNKEPIWIIKTGKGGPRYEGNLKYGQHIEKQDYSGLNDFEQAIHRGFLCAGVVNVPVNIIKETAQDCLAHLPADWSEDFDKEVENIHKRYPEVSFAKLTRIAYHFSKWASRRKDIEWSEEDEETRKDIIAGLEATKRMLYRADASGQACYNRWIDWLKSLRSHPKQEQPEVDLDTEIHEKALQLHTAPTYEELESFARHFYELGKKEK